jgi:hypothetical protein
MGNENKGMDAGAVPRVRFLDYLLLLCGCGLSLWLAELMEVRLESRASDPSPFRQVFHQILPKLLFLPLGLQLFWPFFFAEQRFLGRKQSLTMGEWLLGLAWLGTLALVGWIIWQATGNIPEMLVTRSFRHNLVFGYMLTVLSLGAIALVLWILDLMWRRAQPWTHTLGLALMVWPNVPLACMWVGGMKLE